MITSRVAISVSSSSPRLESSIGRLLELVQLRSKIQSRPATPERGDGRVELDQAVLERRQDLAADQPGHPGREPDQAVDQVDVEELGDLAATSVVRTTTAS